MFEVGLLCDVVNDSVELTIGLTFGSPWKCLVTKLLEWQRRKVGLARCVSCVITVPFLRLSDLTAQQIPPRMCSMCVTRLRRWSMSRELKSLRKFMVLSVSLVMIGVRVVGCGNAGFGRDLMKLTKPWLMILVWPSR